MFGLFTCGLEITLLEFPHCQKAYVCYANGCSYDNCASCCV